ncbi:hypothetical protein R82526_03247 [Ralstonia mannitolilytica]|uniref:hypothetical protein n=1 Tax=Ralstonia mannitolilytica TaxID=105219 RepID=UPI0007AFF5DF|nr:hypothetical protein [Ralstonia mannitolilytica]ANA35579.1 hypothetical protein VZ52_19385 [Ralstonia mannitolilytica]CAJ0688997.1 hypothetical protein R82526_03247 [Ralstonia mannitolilytica]CAJ0883978.1 hypothetical protein R76727_03610 [Ralstonia mannitolilytica]
MELSFVAPGTQTHRYALKLAGLPETTPPIDPAWIDDALTAAVRVFDAHRVHFADAYFAYRARDAAQHPHRTEHGPARRRVAGDLHDDTPLLADTFAIAQLAALVSLEAAGLADVIDVHLVVERLRDDERASMPASRIDEVMLATGSPAISPAARRPASQH